MTIKIRMMPRGISRAVTNFKRRSEALGKNKRQMFKIAAVQTLNWIDKNFKAEGKLHDDNSLHWKPLSKTTVALRRKHTTTILQDTGRLKSGWDIQVLGNNATVRSRVNYSSLHEFGGTAQLGGKTFRVPKRKILPDDKQALKIVVPAVEKYLKKNGF